jgi:TonB family protein
MYLMKPGLSAAGRERKVQMPRTQLFRSSLLTIVTIATLWSAPVMLQATELHPLVITGIALDKVTIAHPTPQYPSIALRLRIDGNVRVTVNVRTGKIVEATASSGAPLLAYEAKQWIVRNWKFKPEITGVFTIPISYKRQA